MSRTLNTIFIAIILIFGAYLFGVSTFSPVEPVGRLNFVKMANPDMYPGHPSSEVLADYAKKRGSSTVMVVHYGGDSTYRRYMEGDVLIIQMAFVNPDSYRTDIDWSEVVSSFIFGVPEDKYRYRADGNEFDNLDDAMDYVMGIARSNGQEGPIPMYFHGTVREGNPIINPGCGFPLFVELSWKYYGRIATYYFIARALIHPFLNNPYANYELTHYQDLNKLYNQGDLDYTIS
ncbi:MAG: hypothetical protein CIT03_09800 [Methanobacterium sp.]|nr:MAG: hypothetical protein CIT03_09800 [Methanobacterium sp.]